MTTGQTLSTDEDHVTGMKTPEKLLYGLWGEIDSSGKYTIKISPKNISFYFEKVHIYIFILYFIQWWENKNYTIYTSITQEFPFYYFILLLHYISERNILSFTLLNLFKEFVLCVKLKLRNHVFGKLYANVGCQQHISKKLEQ